MKSVVAPLVIAIVRSETPRSWSSAFRLGLLTGVVYFAGTLYWLVETMTTFGGLAIPVAVLAAGLLVQRGVHQRRRSGHLRTRRHHDQGTPELQHHRWHVPAV